MPYRNETGGELLRAQALSGTVEALKRRLGKWRGEPVSPPFQLVLAGLAIADPCASKACTRGRRMRNAAPLQPFNATGSTLHAAPAK